jgi:hypothetical protein
MEEREELNELVVQTKKLQCAEGRIDLEISQNSVLQSRKILVGKLLTKKKIGRSLLKEILQKVWNPRYDFEVSVVDNNKFVFMFQHEVDKRKIFEFRPWTVKGHLLILKECQPHLSVSEIEFESTELWIQIHGLPLDSILDSNVKRIGQKVGTVLDVDLASESSMIWKKFVRVRVEMDLAKPLVAGMFAPRPDREIWIQLKYEKVLEFCYSCGKLGHIQQECGDPVQKLMNPFGYKFQLFGKWIRTDNAEIPEGVYQNGDSFLMNRQIGVGNSSQRDGTRSSMLMEGLENSAVEKARSEEALEIVQSQPRDGQKNEESDLAAGVIISGKEVIEAAFNKGGSIEFLNQQQPKIFIAKEEGDVGGHGGKKSEKEHEFGCFGPDPSNKSSPFEVGPSDISGPLEVALCSAFNAVDQTSQPWSINSGWAGNQKIMGLKRKGELAETNEDFKRPKVLGYEELKENFHKLESPVRPCFSMGFFFKEEASNLRFACNQNLKKIARSKSKSKMGQAGEQEDKRKQDVESGSASVCEVIPEVQMAEEAGLNMPHLSP